MNISACILEYLKQFGSIIVPGFGVFSVEYSKAIINSENGSILPPAGRIAFMLDYEVDSDELAAFIADHRHMSLEASKSDLKIQIDFWKKRLKAEQHLEIQSLGELSFDEETIHFKGNRLETDQPDFYGLEEIKLSEIEKSDMPPIESKSTEKDYQFSRVILWIFLLIIPILGLLYLAYTQQELLFGKKSFQDISVQTKTHRIKDSSKVSMRPIQVKSDSLKKHSLSENHKKETKILSTKNKH
ncbi:hypothetical protein D1631_04470 [Chryseobacterium nematophagum]|uniref:CCDC81-like prokaryotic HU domain-containing protein n=1 Tax=Chryseobacterium nematophagum TaxID=2305228 RepID=A0A3M7TCM9_9FLAO|nr:hypothetical protein [Chryseobacterium nematophagum]RNA61245.1 hypothetical protein D1631_04470 [Chryseobacterium nematophagum]